MGIDWSNITVFWNGIPVDVSSYDFFVTDGSFSAVYQSIRYYAAYRDCKKLSDFKRCHAILNGKTERKSLRKFYNSCFSEYRTYHNFLTGMRYYPEWNIIVDLDNRCVYSAQTPKSKEETDLMPDIYTMVKAARLDKYGDFSYLSLLRKGGKIPLDRIDIILCDPEFDVLIHETQNTPQTFA